MFMEAFEEALRELNTEQKKAVETIDGPVMVVAGPGTGKTQVLALRIAYILKKTDLGADSVLCLTFTRSGVTAMRERLERYIGTDARKVHIATFHSFAGDLVEKYYQLLDFDTLPELIDETQSVLLVDELLHNYEWEYIRPRTNPGQYFGDLKGLISLLKRERMTPAVFLDHVEKEIVALKEDPESISSRGESKGQLKKEVEKKIESLLRTQEVVAFYRLYEEIKKERSLMDYDDVLEYAVALVEQSEEVRDELREMYQYVLVDEHQDSSGVQNSFLRAGWQGVEKPNIFVVGDDRQLIYGFSGASLSYFEEFRSLFGPAVCITLKENYRSTEQILALADDLLQSSVSKEKLSGNRGGGEAVGLYQYVYERDELLGVAQYFKQKIEEGIPPEECALLVPKNRHVRSAISLLRSFGISVASTGSVSLFSQTETQSFLRVLRIVSNPYDTVALSESLLDPWSGVEPLAAHRFLHEQKGKAFTLDTLTSHGDSDGLFAEQSSLVQWGNTLKTWISECTGMRVGELISRIGTDLLIHKQQSHSSLLRCVEIVRSLLHSTTVWEERQKGRTTLKEYLEYVARLEEYGHDIPLASFEEGYGIRVMTLHKSKGLEYDHVWIAHMNEETVMAQKRSAFTLPELVKEKIEERDRAAATRELYVALTRAKKECIISYAAQGYDGRLLSLSEIIADLPKVHFEIKESSTTEKMLLEQGPEVYVLSPQQENNATFADIEQFVRENYASTKVSVTLLNNFFDCPWKWYFRNFLKLPEVKGVSLALGSAVHSIIEFILKAEKLPPEEVIKEKILYELQKEGVVGKEELRTLSKDAGAAVGRWVTQYYPHLAAERVSERSVSFRDEAFPHLHMYGKIDLTERLASGEVQVTDFKTGKAKTIGEIEKATDDGRLSDYMRQLAMYSYLIRGAEKKDVYHSRLLFVESGAKEKNALYETHIDQGQIDLLVRDIKEYDELLKSGTWTRQMCHHKGFGGQTECPYCALIKKIIEQNGEK
jgi:DNA helicase II / ATP-dependent DNA helicase PcrA